MIRNIRMIRKTWIPMLGLMALLLVSCKASRQVEYFQGLSDDAIIRTANPENVKVRPLDKFTITVNSLNSQVSSMFNLRSYKYREINSSLDRGNNFSDIDKSDDVTSYTVDDAGNIDFPYLGTVHVAGLTRQQMERRLKQLLIESNQVKDPVVTVEALNMGVSVLGEVKTPGRYKIDRDVFTILDALSIAGDMNLTGNRTNVKLIRREGNQSHVYTFDFTNADSVYSSPAFYMQQGDVVYVAPIRKRQRETTVNGNNVLSAPFWMSAASLLVSLGVLLKK